MREGVRILLLADSHIGFDLPVQPRVGRRRRGHDFLANYATALKPAFTGEVDLVVHAGDVFDRPNVDATAAYQALDPLRRIAERGVAVFIVPGNHERSRIRHARFSLHPNVHVFDRPRTYTHDVRGVRITLTGFPYERRNVRAGFRGLLERAEWNRDAAALRLLCIHHCVEGATVGPGDFTFTTAADVIRHRDVPPEFTAVLSGHIHRHQVLSRDLGGRPLDVPVLYPGSIERTATAEIGETKGFMIVTVDAGAETRVRWEFRPLPARPMVRKDISVDEMSDGELESTIRAIVDSVPPDAVLSIRVAGQLTDAHWRRLSAGHLRTFVPESMNVDIVPAKQPVMAESRSSRVSTEEPGLQLSLGA